MFYSIPRKELLQGQCFQEVKCSPFRYKVSTISRRKYTAQTEKQKICCWAVGKEMSVLTDIGIFLLFKASRESFPSGEPF